MAADGTGLGHLPPLQFLGNRAAFLGVTGVEHRLAVGVSDSPPFLALTIAHAPAMLFLGSTSILCNPQSSEVTFHLLDSPPAARGIPPAVDGCRSALAMRGEVSK